MVNIFEQASRWKLRFVLQSKDSKYTNLTCDDLWDLTLDQLNVMAKKLNRELKLAGEESFISEIKGNKYLELCFTIVKYVINFKLESKKQAETAKIKKEYKNKLFAFIEKKQEADMEKDLDGKSLSELMDIAKNL